MKLYINKKKSILKNRLMMLLYLVAEKSRDDDCQFVMTSALVVVCTPHFFVKK